MNIAPIDTMGAFVSLCGFVTQGGIQKCQKPPKAAMLHLKDD